MIQLRPDQLAAEADVYRSWNEGHRNVLLVASTGWGKSVVLSNIALRQYLLGSTQAVIAHRNELVGQLSSHVASRGMPHRIIAAKDTIKEITRQHREEFGRSFVNPDAKTAVISVDTMLARKDELKTWFASVDDFTLDEAHHAQGNEVREGNKWGRAIRLFTNAKGLGVTASPTRGDGGGMGRYQSDGSDGDGPFHAMVQAPPMRWLIDNGCLCDYEIAIPTSDFVIDENATGSDGDFTKPAMRQASDKSQLVGDVIKEYVARAYGKRAICFAIDVKDANDIAKRFNNIGIPAASVNAKTPGDVRREYIRRFRDGRLRVLVNVDLFGEGFDVPAVEVVIMARPTASLAVYLQQFGRALRLLAGKLYGLIIDHVSNWKRHGFPDKEHHWSMDRREKRGKTDPDPEEIDLVPCRGCSRPYEAYHAACPHCGWTKPLPVPGANGRTIQQVDGDFTLIDAATRARMMAATQLETPAAVAQRIGGTMGHMIGTANMNRQIELWAAQERLKLAIAQWAAIQRAKGRSDEESYRRFYLTTNVDVLSALSADHSRQDFEKMAAMVEGWCNG